MSATTEIVLRDFSLEHQVADAASRGFNKKSINLALVLREICVSAKIYRGIGFSGFHFSKSEFLKSTHKLSALRADVFANLEMADMVRVCNDTCFISMHLHQELANIALKILYPPTPFEVTWDKYFNSGD